jgi:hypothetical protein
MFTTPGGGYLGGGEIPEKEMRLPLAPTVGERDPHSIASNRRFLRILQDLSAMEKDAAAKLLSEHLGRSMERYQSLFSQYDSALRPRFRADTVKPGRHGGISGPGMITRTQDEKKPVTLGAKYNVLSLVWLAGHVGATQCRDAVKQVVEVAIGQRESLYSDDDVIELYRSEVLRNLSLYNRQILAFGLIRTSPRATELEQILSDRNVAKIRLELTRFDAPMTPYDHYGFYVDPGTGGRPLAIECYGAMDDPTFNKVVSECMGEPEGD